MTTRPLILAAVILLTFAVVTLIQRRGRLDLTSGITLVVGDGCALCPLALSALERSGVPHRVIPLSEAGIFHVRSLPTLLGVASDGSVQWRRSGRAAVDEASRLGGKVL